MSSWENCDDESQMQCRLALKAGREEWYTRTPEVVESVKVDELAAKLVLKLREAAMAEIGCEVHGWWG